MPRKTEAAKLAARNWTKSWRARLAELEGRSDGLTEAESRELQLLALRREIKRQRSREAHINRQKAKHQPETVHIELPPVGPLLDLQRKVLDDLRALQAQGLGRVG
jgi:hypothetical protein